MKNPAINLIFGRIVFAAVCLLALLLSGCGDSGNTDTSTGSDPGSSDQSELLISLTDAEGDFLTYIVNVDSITLTRANGATIEALPISTTVDFAQYVDVTELLSIATVPAGRYTSAEITLDFSNALITVQDDQGNPVTANVVDANGDPLTTATVAVEFAGRDGFTLRRGIPAQVTLDFDLDASNNIVINGSNATVTVNPVFVADTVLDVVPHTFRLRGLLGQVAVNDDLFAMDLRPFRHRNGPFGSARVRVNETTRYEINKQLVANEDGLAALQALGAGSAVITEGQWNRVTHRFTAEYVYAGSSVPWSDADMLRGTVVSRSGDTLTVRGATVEMAGGQFSYNDNVTVDVSDNTQVLSFADGIDSDSIADISVGSAVYVVGDVTAPAQMDATQGYVRVHYGSISGSVVSAGPLTVDLGLINGRRIDLFDFAGTGVDATNDADPDNYEINTGTLNLAGINIGDPIRLRGLVAPFGSAPEDFTAQTVINAANVVAHMVICYGQNGAATAISSLDESGILLDPADATGRHHLIQAGIMTDLNSLPAMPVVIPGDDPGVYAITEGLTTRVYSSYSEFLDALTTELDAGRLVSRFDAHGYYDDGAATFTSNQIRVTLVAID